MALDTEKWHFYESMSPVLCASPPLGSEPSSVDFQTGSEILSSSFQTHLNLKLIRYYLTSSLQTLTVPVTWQSCPFTEAVTGGVLATELQQQLLDHNVSGAAGS